MIRSPWEATFHRTPLFHPHRGALVKPLLASKARAPDSAFYPEPRYWPVEDGPLSCLAWQNLRLCVLIEILQVLFLHEEGSLFPTPVLSRLGQPSMLWLASLLWVGGGRGTQKGNSKLEPEVGLWLGLHIRVCREVPHKLISPKDQNVFKNGN